MKSAIVSDLRDELNPAIVRSAHLMLRESLSIPGLATSVRPQGVVSFASRPNEGERQFLAGDDPEHQAHYGKEAKSERQALKEHVHDLPPISVGIEGCRFVSALCNNQRYQNLRHRPYQFSLEQRADVALSFVVGRRFLLV